MQQNVKLPQILMIKIWIELHKLWYFINSKIDFLKLLFFYESKLIIYASFIQNMVGVSSIITSLTHELVSLSSELVSFIFWTTKNILAMWTKKISHMDEYSTHMARILFLWMKYFIHVVEKHFHIIGEKRQGSDHKFWIFWNVELTKKNQKAFI